MRAKASCGASLLLLGILLVAGPGAAVPVFSDNFDAETGSGQGASGQSQTSYTGFVNWTVSDGTVDLVAHTDFGIDCFGGAGKCVDLDGATSNAGVLTSSALNLGPGSYTLSFQLSGTDAGFGGAAINPNVVDISVGGFLVEQVTVNRGDPYALYSYSFAVGAPAVVSIVFANQGGDNFGAMLDEVSLELVPEPGTAALLTLGLSALAVARRRQAR